MAGLGEACSHVAAVLFLLEANSQLKRETSCTSRPCYWLPPAFKTVPFARISDIDFTSAQTKKKKVLSTASSSLTTESSMTNRCQSKAVTSYRHEPTPSELNDFYSALAQAGKPVILSVTPGFCDAYVTLEKKGVLPPPLSDLFEEHYLDLSYLDLLQKCEDVFNTLSVTPMQAKKVEEHTRGQSQSKTWFDQRAARITASKFKASTRTDITQPSQSLIKAICYPESFRFTSQATEWGCTHEKQALSEYEMREKDKHSNFVLSPSGLVLSSEYPHFGASSDGIASCTCCAKRVLEVKCPYSCKEKSFIEAVTTDSNFCLEEVTGKLLLKHDHAYYYQIQLQMKLCQTTHGDFIVWRENELIVERVSINEQFLAMALEKATKFYTNGVLPEVLGKWYSKLPEYQTSRSTEPMNTDNQVWCYCKGSEDGEMIGCDNTECDIGWFHTECLRITVIPKGKWYCPNCSRERSKRRKIT